MRRRKAGQKSQDGCWGVGDDKIHNGRERGREEGFKGKVRKPKMWASPKC